LWRPTPFIKVFRKPGLATTRGRFFGIFIKFWLLLFAMGRNDKISMPSSGAGITRYFDDYKSKIEFKPAHVIVLAVIVIIIEIVLSFLAPFG